MTSSTKTSPLQRLKGTHDILPEEAYLWSKLELEARTLLWASGFGEIRPPVLEFAELYARGVGEGTDIVSKEMFSFERSERLLCLRPEGTAGVVRSYIENGLHRWAKPVRLFYIGAMFRYERPQEGRQRQFHQLGVEVFGQDTPQLDAEVIALSWQLFKRLGLQNDVTLLVNNVGEPEDRPAFRSALQGVLEKHLPELCPDCQRRYEQNPLRMLDCKVPTCKTIYNGNEVESFLQNYRFSEASNEAFEQTLAYLTEMGIAYKRDTKLVRGLDYYNRTVFEWQTDKLGAQSALCGGGRYNSLVEKLGGPETPAVGWGIGLERLLNLMKKLDKVPASRQFDVYVVSEASSFTEALKLAESLREKGLLVELDTSGKPMNKQMTAASKRESKIALILGAQELEEQQVQLKRMDTGEKASLALNDTIAISNAIKGMLQ